MGRLHKLGATLLLTAVLGAAGAAVAWLAAPDLRVRLLLVLAWLVVANRLAAKAWDLTTRRAVRRWRSSFRGRVRRFGLENVKPRPEEEGSDLIRVVCT